MPATRSILDDWRLEPIPVEAPGEERVDDPVLDMDDDDDADDEENSEDENGQSDQSDGDPLNLG
jgi:hypothetical protein